jgi:hypothetical protein
VLRRLTIGIVLLSMMLHCACRIGFLSYLYQQRHQIALSLGMIDEVPIAVCSHKYDANQGLHIEMADDSSNATLPAVFHAQEIQLFFNGFLDIDFSSREGIAQSGINSMVVEKFYASPALSIFHPPCS